MTYGNEGRNEKWERRAAKQRKARYGLRVHNHAVLERLANDKAKAKATKGAAR